MKDFDLESKLKAWRVPERDEEYWDTFAQRVLAHAPQPAEERPIPSSFMPRLAFACLAVGFLLWQSGVPKTLRNDERQLRATLVRLPGNVGRLMQDEHGLHSLIEDPQ